MPKLGVNVDHVATVRQARLTIEPSPIEAAHICESAGASSIVAHLRQDRRHINDQDVRVLKKTVKTRLNLEMSCAVEIVSIACAIKPNQSTLVPEKRKELTTEGGLDIVKNKGRVGKVIDKLRKSGIIVNLFIDPEEEQIKASRDVGADAVELHTGEYANSQSKRSRVYHLKRLHSACQQAGSMGLIVNAGHGLTYTNVKPIARIDGVEELNIGHSIISRAVLVGLDRAVREMLELIK